MKYGFIGCGNMGGSLATALRQSTKDILLSSKSVTSARELAQKLQCRWTDSNSQVIEQCDVVILAVKPQMMAAVLAPLQAVLAHRKPILISVAAGLSLEKLGQMAGSDLPIIRFMPNTPVSIGKGMVTYCCSSRVDSCTKENIIRDFRSAGQFDEIAESQMDAATAAAGCTPAYAFMFIDAIAEGAAACGLSKEKAILYAATAVSGAAELLLHSGEAPDALRDAVCSPGGSTIAGVHKLQENEFQAIVMKAIRAAWLRNIELGK